MRFALPPILIAPLLLVGCGEEPAIQRYEVAKPVGYSWPDSPLRDAGYETDAMAWVWDVPEGWVDAPELPSGLIADYRFQGAGTALPGRATVAKLDGDAGGVNANVMRWLNQIYITEITGPGPKDKIVGPFPHLGAKVTLVDLHGQFQGEHMPTNLYAGIIQIPADGGGVYQTWTFKLAGDLKTVEQHRAGLAQMILTFRPKGLPRPPLTEVDGDDVGVAQPAADPAPQEPAETP